MPLLRCGMKPAHPRKVRSAIETTLTRAFLILPVTVDVLELRLQATIAGFRRPSARHLTFSTSTSCTNGPNTLTNITTANPRQACVRIHLRRHRIYPETRVYYPYDDNFAFKSTTHRILGLLPQSTTTASTLSNRYSDGGPYSLNWTLSLSLEVSNSCCAHL